MFYLSERYKTFLHGIYYTAHNMGSTKLKKCAVYDQNIINNKINNVHVHLGPIQSTMERGATLNALLKRVSA